MEYRTSQSSGWLARAFVAAGTGILAATLLAAPVAAGPKHRHSKHFKQHHKLFKHHKHHRHDHARFEFGRRDHGHGHGYRHLERRFARGHFAAPGRIGHAHVEVYRPYYRGRAYYGPHRHYHATYHFPVWDDHGSYVYRPHHYCDGRLFGSVSYHGPRLSFGIEF